YTHCCAPAAPACKARSTGFDKGNPAKHMIRVRRICVGSARTNFLHGFRLFPSFVDRNKDWSRGGGPIRPTLVSFLLVRRYGSGTALQSISAFSISIFPRYAPTPLLHFCCYTSVSATVSAATLLLFTNPSPPATSTICYRFGATFLHFPFHRQRKTFFVNSNSFCFSAAVLWSWLSLIKPAESKLNQIK